MHKDTTFSQNVKMFNIVLLKRQGLIVAVVNFYDSCRPNLQHLMYCEGQVRTAVRIHGYLTDSQSSKILGIGKK